MSKNLSMDFQIKLDNTKKVTEEMQQAIARALEIIGGKAETYAKENCPVLTGRLRNSITHQLEPDGRTVDIGSNVSYAAWNELHNPRKPHFLRNACENHKEEYKSVIEGELK